MVRRCLHTRVQQALAEVPAVCLVGPRQAGKTTLALAIAVERESVYLDLESPQDRAKLQDAETYLERHQDKLVILDELHRMPELLPLLRSQIDRGRRSGRPVRQYLLLGSASLGLLRHVGEALTGRVRILELTPFFVLEPHGAPLEQLWLRGGFPESLLAANDGQSFRWRYDFLRAYLERELPLFTSARLPVETLWRLWTMLAHRQGAPYNAAELARSLGLDVRTVNRYVNTFVDLFLLRRLQPWYENVGKRLVKAPRLYLRDSGLLHALLGIRSLEDLLAHPIAGASWEGWVIENIAASAPKGTGLYFYRTSAGAEIDLLLLLPTGTRWAVEIKRSLAPHPSRGFHLACDDVKAERRWLIYPGQEQYPTSGSVEVVGLRRFCEYVSQAVR